MRLKVYSLLSALLLSAFSAGAADQAEPATYTQVQARVFSQCVMCHSGAKPKAGIDLSSYAALMHNPNTNVILPGSPDHSLVYTEIASGKMPPRGTPVAAADLALLRDWITNGAKND